MSCFKLWKHMHIIPITNCHTIQAAAGAITRYDFNSLSFSIISKIVDTVTCSPHSQIRIHKTGSIHCFRCTSFRMYKCQCEVANCVWAFCRSVADFYTVIRSKNNISFSISWCFIRDRISEGSNRNGRRNCQHCKCQCEDFFLHNSQLSL